MVTQKLSLVILGKLAKHKSLCMVAEQARPKCLLLLQPEVSSRSWG